MTSSPGLTGLTLWMLVVAMHAAFRLGQDGKWTLAYQAFEKGRAVGTDDAEQRILKVLLTHGMHGNGKKIRHGDDARIAPKAIYTGKSGA